MHITTFVRISRFENKYVQSASNKTTPSVRRPTKRLSHRDQTRSINHNVSRNFFLFLECFENESLTKISRVLPNRIGNPKRKRVSFKILTEYENITNGKYYIIKEKVRAERL